MPFHYEGQVTNSDLKLGRLLELGGWWWGPGHDLFMSNGRFLPLSLSLSLPPFSLSSDSIGLRTGSQAKSLQD